MADSETSPAPDQPVLAGQTAKGRYEQLISERFAYLQRARDASRLTIVTLVPPAGTTGATKLPTPYQSLGARGVNNLSAKLWLSLFPPNSNFFRLTVSDAVIQSLQGPGGGQDGTNFRTMIEQALAKYEREVQDEFEVNSARVSALEAIKHLIVAGNALAYLQPDGALRIFHIGDYVVKRDPSGNVMEHITEERVDPDTLPPEVAASLPKGTSSKDGKRSVCIHTWVRRVKKTWRTRQEVEGILVPGSLGSYPIDKSPWMPLRWNRVDGEDYGRGFVEEYQGDLQSLEALTQAIVEGSAAAAKVLFLVKPNGTTKAKTIAEAPNGAVREGNAEDVSTLQMEKYNDFKITAETCQKIEDRLSFAFMLNSAVQRNAERVTAEEVRYTAQELESTQGGLYSVLSLDFQLPLVRRYIYQMERSGKLPQLPSKAIKPTIVTGLAALGRGNDLQKLDDFLSGASTALGPQVVAQFINGNEYLARRATALGIDPTGLVKTADQIAQEQQQAHAQALTQNVGPNVVKGVSDVAVARENARSKQAKPQQANGPAAAPAQ